MPPTYHVLAGFYFEDFDAEIEDDGQPSSLSAYLAQFTEEQIAEISKRLCTGPASEYFPVAAFRGPPSPEVAPAILKEMAEYPDSYPDETSVLLDWLTENLESDFPDDWPEKNVHLDLRIETPFPGEPGEPADELFEMLAAVYIGADNFLGDWGYETLPSPLTSGSWVTSEHHYRVYNVARDLAAWFRHGADQDFATVAEFERRGVKTMGELNESRAKEGLPPLTR